MAPNEHEYTAESIEVLPGTEAVRRRPGMYIGNIEDGSGMHHMVREVVDHALNEHRDGTASYIQITFDGHRASVEDDGRGIPIQPGPDGRSALELVMTELYAGGHGRSFMWSVGLAPICALSSRLDAEVWRDGRAYVQSYSRGVPLGPVQDLGPATRTGTRVSFTPDFSIVPPLPWDLEHVAGWGRMLAAFHPRLTVIVDHDAYRCPRGMADHVRYLARTARISELLHVRASHGTIGVEAALAWTDRSTTCVHGFVNGVTDANDGTHVAGIFDGLRVALAHRIPELRRVATPAFRERIQPGITACVHVTVDDPRFTTSMRSWLANPEVGEAVSAVVSEALAMRVADNPALLDSILLRLDV
jgi:DNA gyrase/topoisomerase IV subunit B